MDLRRAPRKLDCSPRHLALRHGRRVLRSLRATVEDTTPGIKRGEEQLFSFYVPGLAAGVHKIEVEQHVDTGSDKKTIPSKHEFNVIAPRFSLPDGAIHSIYPPQGHADRGEVLPNVLFTDPTLPWERIASWKSEKEHPADYNNNRVPWLAVFLFTQDELRLSQSEISSIFQKIPSQTDAKQSGTLSINMLVADVSQLQDTATSVVYDPEADGATVKTDAIFLRSELFNSLFAKYDKNGARDPAQTTGEVYHHRFLAHLRHIHLDGTPSAATTDDEDHAYSVVVCHRTGPLSIKQPTTVVAHLVNIEGVEAMNFPVKNQKYVCMSSLYAWEFTCLPPDSLNVADAFTYLGETLTALTPKLSKEDLSQLSGPVGNRVAKRLNDGFSLARYRIQTGEVTAAFFRGPFAPSTVDFPKETPWPLSSTTGTKLQILDQELNIMDITYSAAWNLGKTLALANQDFAAALSRVRKQIFDIALNEARLHAIKSRAASLGVPSAYKTREEVVKTIASTIEIVASLPKKKVLQSKSDGMAMRWFRQELPRLDLTYKGQEIDPIIDDYLEKAAYKVASSTDGEDIPYNEYNTPFSTDWMIVLRWVLDRYYLVDVPPHYLITDPSHVPQESLRFFTIDHNWVSAMVDGGLSLANHVDRSDDRLRSAIKAAINRYLETEIPILKYRPPIPSYGFYVRSALVTKFPDLVVDIDPPPSHEWAPVVLRHEMVGPDTMLCLMREAPVEPEFHSLFLREPPHQQYFAAAKTLTAEYIDMDYKRVYTDPNADDPNRTTPISYTIHRNTPNPHGSIFIWGTSPKTDDVRCLNMENFANDLHQTIKKTFEDEHHPGWYQEPFPTAALMGIQLNEPRWQLSISLPDKKKFPGLFAASENKYRTLALSPKRQIRAQATIEFTPQSIACGPHPAFGARKRAILEEPLHLPPHFRMPRPIFNVTSPNIADGPASAPVFNYAVYPVGKKPGASIPMLKGKQDLIFSIVYEKDAQNFNMEKLKVSIPLGRPAPLMTNYKGTGPTMLSNLRFNVLAQFSNDEKLVLTLIPRSTLGYVPVKKIPEMSFMLSGVEVESYNSPTSIKIDVEVKYQQESPWPFGFFALLEPVS
ncbi:hypothetical protein D8B26_007694 [Coccidioides posadasii str. Silveira]|uniref:Uncharacterized protein n=2 Tax=Coccidioides posadasii TaxID=199306 RepID=E9D2Q3_COCPS|nr:hypothetical protein CPC735_016950 [Coccidioides posadasii C735 delta SOWgp]EER25094.1 hypothetical protein CPC735_016950 [Coccidioides posadasii C735 delta SOWgp]EFW19466.1 conserved hypothetical protein [Coccidioides posadasii str. Silveira]QVM13079.1 hypothetical protein D8B26_007694 [Coccidioides posadasii str. Silveira]|eukprot:XP_003067239.1 hypothetical protein CPC735_016950 [Coccidioides posadasii C735 delta SOWgp]